MLFFGFSLLGHLRRKVASARIRRRLSDYCSSVLSVSQFATLSALLQLASPNHEGHRMHAPLSYVNPRKASFSASLPAVCGIYQQQDPSTVGTS